MIDLFKNHMKRTGIDIRQKLIMAPFYAHIVILRFFFSVFYFFFNTFFVQAYISEFYELIIMELYHNVN